MTNMRQVLKTDRLVLEPQSMARFDQWFAMERQRDEAGHRDLTEDQAWLRLCARQGMWDAYACGFYYLLDPVSGEMRGEAGFQFRRRGFGPGFDNHPEAAWAVASAHQGRGLAAEAMQALLAHHDRSSGRQRVVALIARSNLPSLRLAERLGFRGYSDVAFDGAAHLLLERAG
ncbi:GNAT family acetyltransferase [Bordetella pertussis]|nr:MULTISPECIES: GNAT family protein [Bordetella]AEE66287.1 GnaT-family acetyltransferase [Bordetella pertussis CS]PNO98209.1 N-acetyltransferase [Bordetella pertussis 18323]CAE41161.1 probable GnaT-family acetyltransferase [Bordetella pertussis Tohama I]AIW93276.1 GnaT-family acetyltransferase [Bordetella pertussis B1917]AIW94799.1 GnaT-family acetyltransferase [Bordetella pertussis B1920]